MGITVSTKLSKDTVLRRGERKPRVWLMLAVDNDGVAFETSAEKELSFCTDISSSMNQKAGGGESAISVTKDAIAKAVQSLNPNDSVSIVTFNQQMNWLLPKTRVSDRELILAAIRSLKAEGNTYFTDAIKASVLGQGLHRCILTTDGVSTVSPKSDEEGSLQAVADDSASPIWAFGIGNEYNPDFLQSLANRGKPGSFYRHVSTADELYQEFQLQAQILRSIGDITNLEIRFVAANATIVKAARLIPDQIDIPIDMNGLLVSYFHGDLDMQGQLLFLELDINATLLNDGINQLGTLSVSYSTPSGPKRTLEIVEFELTSNEAAATKVNQEVNELRERVKAYRQLTAGNIADAAASFTQGGRPDLAEQLNTLRPNDENGRRRVNTIARTANNKTISGRNNTLPSNKS